jgi:hypothetical protein
VKISETTNFSGLVWDQFGGKLLIFKFIYTEFKLDFSLSLEKIAGQCPVGIK